MGIESVSQPIGQTGIRLRGAVTYGDWYWTVAPEIAGYWNGTTVTVKRTGGDYSSVDTAIKSVASGTLILVYPYNLADENWQYYWTLGDAAYSINNTIIMRGVGSAPTGQSNPNPETCVKFQAGSFRDILQVGTGRLIIENIQIEMNVEWYRCVNVNDDGKALVNRCLLRPKQITGYPFSYGINYPIGGNSYTGPASDAIYIRNSKLIRGHAHISGYNLALSNVTFDKVVLKQFPGPYPYFGVETDDVLTTYLTTGSLAGDDYVGTDTAGYGFEYGSDLIYQAQDASPSVSQPIAQTGMRLRKPGVGIESVSQPIGDIINLRRSA